MRELSVQSVQEFCGTRDVELVLAAPPSPHVFMLRGEYDAQGHFFSVLASGVEYLDFANGTTVGSMLLCRETRELADFATKWDHLGRAISGSALVIRSPSAAGLATGLEWNVVVANTITLLAGPDWPE